MKDLTVLVEVFETRDLAEDIVAVRGEVEVYLSNRLACLFRQLLVSDSLKEGLTDVSCADWPASMGCF